jgi:hypothetical protein
MRKKVIPFPPRKAVSDPPVPPGRSRIVIHVGAQRYAIDINREALVLSPEAAPAAKPAGVEELQVQTRFLRLYEPAVLGDHIDGWQVCWVGGWDKGKVVFVVMVERVVRGGGPTPLDHPVIAHREETGAAAVHHTARVISGRGGFRFPSP